MSPREGARRPKFGRIDPFCLMAVLPVLLVAGILGALVNVALGLGCAAFAGLILLFDSWANRPSSRAVRRAEEPEARRPARPPARTPRPPAARGPRPAEGRAPIQGRAPVRRTGPPPPQRTRQAPRGAQYR
ncbi:hypothetical protein [Amycolatopsis sp. cmx-4-68]|uniref:hypothetical protein n=1 Tax=Amycolatopsis sp. cmx-4-68 TaxID=2790938 RepID=UPI00397E7150